MFLGQKSFIFYYESIRNLILINFSYQLFNFFMIGVSVISSRLIFQIGKRIRLLIRYSLKNASISDIN